MSNGQCTQKQANTLQKFGYNPNVSFDEASRIIDMIAANGWKRPEGQSAAPQAAAPQRQSGGGQATSGQKRVLQKFGYNPNVSFAEARHLLDELKANNWQRPDGQAPAQTPPPAVQSGPVPQPVPAQVAPQFSPPPQQFASYEDLPTFGQ